MARVNPIELTPLKRGQEGNDVEDEAEAGNSGPQTCSYSLKYADLYDPRE